MTDHGYCWLKPFKMVHMHFSLFGYLSSASAGGAFVEGGIISPSLWMVL